MTFVAMSRCPSYKNIYIHQPFVYDRVALLHQQKGLAERRIEQAHQTVVAGITEGLLRANNQDQIAAWVPQLIEQRRLMRER